MSYSTANRTPTQSLFTNAVKVPLSAVKSQSVLDEETDDDTSLRDQLSDMAEDIREVKEALAKMTTQFE